MFDGTLELCLTKYEQDEVFAANELPAFFFI